MSEEEDVYGRRKGERGVRERDREREMGGIREESRREGERGNHCYVCYSLWQFLKAKLNS